MKITLITAVFFTFLTTTYGQANFDRKEKELALTNKVKRQIEWTYDYVNGKPGTKGYKSASKVFDRNGYTIEQCTFKSTGDTLSKILYKYDAQGNETAYIRYYKKDLAFSRNSKYDLKGNKLAQTGINGDPRYGGVPFNNTYTHDNNGRVVEIRFTEDKTLTERRICKYLDNAVEMTILNQTGSIIGKETMALDGKQNAIEKAKLIQDYLTSSPNYEYDQSGKKVEETKVRNGIKENRNKYVYDNNGNILQIVDESGAKPYVAYQYKYDAKGNLLEEKWTKEGAAESSRRSYKLDSKGLQVELEYYNASSKFSSLSKYTYEFF